MSRFDTSVVWTVTRNCTLKCPYCNAFDNSKPDTRLYTEWLHVWNDICPAHLEITGGEPFLLPGLVDMLVDLDPAIRFGITTNLTLPIEEFARCIDRRQLLNITCSRHPSMYKQPREMFDGKVRLLVSKGFHVTVNLVAYPDQMYLIPDMKRHYEGMGAHFHVDPYRVDRDMLRYQYSKEDTAFLDRYVTRDRGWLLKPEPQGMNRALCSAGHDHICVAPNGDYWPCMLYQFRDYKPLGNVFVDTNVFKQGTVCNEYSFCIGCDKDAVYTELVR